MSNMNEPWTPTRTPTGTEPAVESDPRVDRSHTEGVLPCPPNPPPPLGWEYWRGSMRQSQVDLAVQMLKDREQYPMGSFVQCVLDDQWFGARVEWHDVQGATGKTGCFRGVNLMRPLVRPDVGPVPVTPANQSYIVQRAQPCMAVDTAAKLDAATIQAVRAANYACIIRYVNLPGVSPQRDIDSAELSTILDGGLALLLVQHVRYPGWNPAHASGVTDAQAAIETARNARYRRGAHLYVDLEGINGTAAATIQFANDWASAVVAAGYLAGAYIGYNVPLSPEQIYDLHLVTSYWSDLGPRKVATRGFAIKQHAQINVHGVDFDPDTIQTDLKGETPAWMIAAAPVANA